MKDTPAVGVKRRIWFTGAISGFVDNKRRLYIE